MDKSGPLKPAAYVVTAQPSITVPATRDSVNSYLKRGWICQPKVDGWNIQIHICPEGRVICFTRNRNRLTTGLPPLIKNQLRENFQGDSGWSVLDGEWVRSARAYYIFDYVVAHGRNLCAQAYRERMSQLPQLSGPVFTIEQTQEIDVAMSILEKEDPLIEGLVLKDPESMGFHHQSMRRCRKDGHRHSNRLSNLSGNN